MANTWPILSHTDCQSSFQTFQINPNYHWSCSLPENRPLQHLQKVDGLGGVVAVVVVDICDPTGVCLPVHEGDDGHEVEGKRHERHPQLAQGVVEGGGEKDSDQGANTDSYP